jgi:peptidoglycan/xylan/chitin deacetylase (PgdA/CDA1 family)
MAAVSWHALENELARWRDAGRAADFWWRDDDAGAPTPALGRLATLARQSGVPLALAAIPERAQEAALAGFDCVVMHGCDHRNRAGEGAKKTEFPEHESGEQALARLAAARERLARLAGSRFVAALVPPWNRLKRDLVARLPEAGILGLSRYGARAAAVPGVVQVNTHVDIIDWQGTRGFVGENEALGLALRHLGARRDGSADAREPTGVLTHHAVHDEAAWRFLGRLFDATRRHGAVWSNAMGFFP